MYYIDPTGPPPVCIQDEVRLVDGPNERQGRLEVCNLGQWGTVCDDGFTDFGAKTVCRELGFSSIGI